jgi:hypothetical protein
VVADSTAAAEGLAAASADQAVAVAAATADTVAVVVAVAAMNAGSPGLSPEHQTLWRNHHDCIEIPSAEHL